MGVLEHMRSALSAAPVPTSIQHVMTVRLHYPLALNFSVRQHTTPEQYVTKL